MILHFIELWLKARTKNVYSHWLQKSLAGTCIIDQRGTKKFEDTQMNLQGQPLHKHQESLHQWFFPDGEGLKWPKSQVFCDFLNSMVYGYNILFRPQSANSFLKTSQVLCSVATTNCGSHWSHNKCFMIFQWEFYQLIYGVAWYQLSRRRTPGLFNINCVPFSVKKCNFWATRGCSRTF